MGSFPETYKLIQIDNQVDVHHRHPCYIRNQVYETLPSRIAHSLSSTTTTKELQNLTYLKKCYWLSRRHEIPTQKRQITVKLLRTKSYLFFRDILLKDEKEVKKSCHSRSNHK